jgi:ABC-type multidrug transport system fused ATPase/permease subunit
VEYDITFEDTVRMMFIDCIWMGVLAWYLANVLPSEFGLQRPWYFVILPSYWLSCFRSKTVVESYEKVSSNDVPVEAVTPDLAAQVTNNRCVDIRGLYKVFNTNSGVKVAVDGLNLTMYSGQITALLGHNGAGKSTAISMLTGLIPVDGGTAIIEGHSISTDMELIRQNLGVCPQHDIVSRP